MIDVNKLTQMSEEDILNLYRQGHKLAEVRSLVCMPANPCDTTDPCYESIGCYSYKYWYVVLGILGGTLYYAYKGIKGCK